MKNFSAKGIRFSGDIIKSCVCFIDLVDSTKNTITMEGLKSIRTYYSTFINYVSSTVKNSNGKVIKNIGDSLLFYFPKTSDTKNVNTFKEAIDCIFKIIDERYKINEELYKQQLPPFSYRISIDYGVLDLALVGDYSQIDLFGSTVNICSKINSSLSVPNEITIGDNLFRILKSFSLFSDNFNFIENGEYKITEYTCYSTYKMKRKNTLQQNKITNLYESSEIITSSRASSVIHHQNNDFHSSRIIDSGLDSHKKNNNKKKRIILVDDEHDILFTYKTILKNYDDYQVTSFTDPSIALNYIQDLPDFDDLLIVLDIRMKNLNGLQLHQQIKSIDPTVKIIFITALDILDELLSIFPGITKEQIIRKPIDNSEFINTIKKLIK